MANTYTQLYVQLVFAVKNRESLIRPEIKSRVEQYMSSITQNHKCKPLSIFCNQDHTHLLLSMKPDVSCSSIVQKIKSATSLFINSNQLIRTHFEWQTGFGAFSYGKSQVDAVCKYILNQETHHKKVSFREEYMELLKAFEVEYQDSYLFEWLF
ncbi:MAG: IS200/IS605 family transposase [Paludibacter sp.]|nr:IS200/IS605 family transposase [Paludibacter sp.]